MSAFSRRTLHFQSKNSRTLQTQAFVSVRHARFNIHMNGEETHIGHIKGASPNEDTVPEPSTLNTRERRPALVFLRGELLAVPIPLDRDEVILGRALEAADAPTSRRLGGGDGAATTGSGPCACARPRCMPASRG